MKHILEDLPKIPATDGFGGSILHARVFLRMKLGILCSFCHMNQIKNEHQQNYENIENS